MHQKVATLARAWAVATLARAWANLKPPSGDGSYIPPSGDGSYIKQRTKKGEASSEEPTPPRTGGRFISGSASSCFAFPRHKQH